MDGWIDATEQDNRPDISIGLCRLKQRSDAEGSRIQVFESNHRTSKQAQEKQSIDFKGGKDTRY